MLRTCYSIYQAAWPDRRPGAEQLPLAHAIQERQDSRLDCPASRTAEFAGRLAGCDGVAVAGVVVDFRPTGTCRHGLVPIGHAGRNAVAAYGTGQVVPGDEDGMPRGAGTLVH